MTPPNRLNIRSLPPATTQTEPGAAPSSGSKHVLADVFPRHPAFACLPLGDHRRADHRTSASRQRLDVGGHGLSHRIDSAAGKGIGQYANAQFDRLRISNRDIDTGGDCWPPHRIRGMTAVTGSESHRSLRAPIPAPKPSDSRAGSLLIATRSFSENAQQLFQHAARSYQTRVTGPAMQPKHRKSLHEFPSGGLE